ncbi:MAG: hypothetical protein WC551_11040 [Patescibacteria group bacterium]
MTYKLPKFNLSTGRLLSRNGKPTCTCCGAVPLNCTFGNCNGNTPLTLTARCYGFADGDMCIGPHSGLFWGDEDYTAYISITDSIADLLNDELGDPAGFTLKQVGACQWEYTFEFTPIEIEVTLGVGISGCGTACCTYEIGSGSVTVLKGSSWTQIIIYLYATGISDGVATCCETDIIGSPLIVISKLYTPNTGDCVGIEEAAMEAFNSYGGELSDAVSTGTFWINE